jgi:hypothetical protein
MARPISGTCESCRSLDVRESQRRDLLRAGLRLVGSGATKPAEPPISKSRPRTMPSC